MILTQDSDSRENAKTTRGDRNRKWRARAHLLLDALIDDVISKDSYHGQVQVGILFKDSLIIGLDSDVRQTIRK